MHHRFFLWSEWLLCLSLLCACSAFGPPDALEGMSRDEVVARMGPPDTERRLDAGSRLEFPRGPYGQQTWFVYFDAAGRASRVEQILTEKNFSRIEVGMAQDEVRQLLGRPSSVQVLGRERGIVWSYRYLSFCNWFQVELTPQQQVRSVGFGEPPECIKGGERPDK